MSNTINLLPVRTKDQIRQELTKFRYDLVTAIIIMGFVVVGVILLFVNALLDYNINNIQSYISIATNTLQSYNKLALNYYTIDKKINQVKIIQATEINPTDVINYISNLAPAGSSLSDFSLNSTETFTVTISSSNYLDIAKLLVELGNPKLKLKQTEIREIDYSKSQNILNFIISGVYSKNG